MYDYDKYEDRKVYEKFSKSMPSMVEQFLGNPRMLKLYENCATKFHVAMLVKRGQIISVVSNKLGSRSKGASTSGSQNFIHAEKNLVLSLGKNYSLLKGADIYVMRFGFDESKCFEFKYSQPCRECTLLLQKCLKRYKLNKVYFTS